MAFTKGNPNPGPPEQVLIVQIAALAAEGVSAIKIAEQLNTSYPRVKRLLEKEETQAVIKEVGQSAIAQARARVNRTLAELTPLAMEALKKNLEEGDLKAVELYLKSLGIYAGNDPVSVGGTTQLQVIIPGAPQPETKDIEIEAQDAESN